MSEREYRQDDQTIGYCDACGSRLSSITTEAKGYCKQHGWRWAQWERPTHRHNGRRWVLVKDDD